MILRRVFLVLILYSSAVSPAPRREGSCPGSASSSIADAQEFDKIVLPITELKVGVGVGFEAMQGTGFCLDPECRFIGTNYHVALMTRPRKIAGQKIVQRYLATGPRDEGATTNDGPSLGRMKYTLRKDLAILELHHSLPKYHGAAFSLDELQTGQEVDIYAYPNQGLNLARRLMRFHGTFKNQTTTGLLAFEYLTAADKAIRPGASGGIVVDTNTQQIVGILSGIANDGRLIALAVPVRSLAEFVIKVQPALAQNLFPAAQEISPDSGDLFPRFVPSPADIQALRHRQEEPSDVRELRSKAQNLSDSMRNFIAVQTLTWGSTADQQPRAAAAYEVQVVDGRQQFRKYPDGKRRLPDVPYPDLNSAIVPGGEWSELPAMLANDLRLKIQHTADIVLNERALKVFQYWADAEDRVCQWTSVWDFQFFSINKDVTVGCYGEVWTDQDANILRISEHYQLPGKWKDYQGVATYGWVRLGDETRRLVPLTFWTQAEYDKKVRWCRGQFMDYRVFTSRANILTTAADSANFRPN